MTADILLIKNKYGKNEQKTRASYSLYNIHTGFIEEYRDVMFLIPMPYARFLGRRVDSSINGAVHEDLIVFDITTKSEIKFPDIYARLRQDVITYSYVKLPMDQSTFKTFYYYEDLSPDCIQFQISISRKGALDDFNADTSVIIHFPAKTIFPDTGNEVMLSGDIMKLCKCTNSIYNLMKNSKGQEYYKYFNGDSIIVETHFLDSDTRYTLYDDYYFHEYYKNFRSAIKLYPYWVRDKKKPVSSVYRCGVWDGEKTIIKPVYELIGVFK